MILLIQSLHQYRTSSSSGVGISVWWVWVEASTTFYVLFLDQPCKCCCFFYVLHSRLNFLSFVSSIHLLISLFFILLESWVVWLASCASHFFFRVFRHILHMRCWSLHRCDTLKAIVWIQALSDCLSSLCTCCCFLGSIRHALTSNGVYRLRSYFLLPLNSHSFRYKTLFAEHLSVQNDRDSRVERMSIVNWVIKKEKNIFTGKK